MFTKVWYTGKRKVKLELLLNNQTLHNQTQLTDENKIRNMKIELETQHHLELC